MLDSVRKRAVLLPLECEGGHALHAETVDDEDLAGSWFVEVWLDASGDKESVKIWAAEGAGGGFDAGEVDPLNFCVVDWIEADYATAVAKGDPEVAIRVNRHAVGRGVVAFSFGVDDNAAVIDFTGFEIISEGADAERWCIDVIHRLCVGAPADAVGVGEIG